MVCLGPRKKEKKANLLSPDDIPGTSRGISGGPTKRGSKLKAPSIKSNKDAKSIKQPQQPSASPRSSVDGRLAQHRTSRTSLNSQRSPSPHLQQRSPSPHQQRPTSPNPRRPLSPPSSSPRNSIHSVRNSGVPTSTSPHNKNAAATTRPGHSRNSSAVSLKKSPVAQMRQDFDTLKEKNDANEQLIAKQQAELELLKQQLATTSPPATPSFIGSNDQPTPPISGSNTLTDIQQTQALLDKEEELKRKEKELALLQEKLEKEVHPIPSIVINESQQQQEVEEEGEEKNNGPLDDQKLAELNERERLLAEREEALEKQRQQIENEQKLALEQVAQQLESLKVENEDKVTQLALKEKELDDLRHHIQENTSSSNSTTTTDNSDQTEKLKKLQEQLEEQKKAHEESLRQHELEIAEKERLLKEQEQSLVALRQAHEDDVRQLKTHQSGNILKIKQQHKQELSQLQQQLEQVEKTKSEQQLNGEEIAKQQQDYLDNELEKILSAFEQAQHNHTVELQNLEKSHQSALSDLQQTHADQLKSLGNAQGYTSTKYIPTQAVSWPAPQPLSMLRKTTGPHPRQNRVLLTSKTNDEPILIPMDTKKVQIYYSSVSGNPLIKKNQDHIQQLLTNQQVEYELVDVASSEAVLQYMKRSNNNGSNEGRAKEVPQLFVGGEYRGQYEDVVKHIDDGTLETLLVPAAEREWTEAERKAQTSKSEQHITITSNSPPVRVLPKEIQSVHLRKTTTLKDEDEALLKELENELTEGNIDLSELEHL
ncbi:hypothetical protein BJ944DRAFT_236973 [Cunninghamella echinulata]|nr:hypothetical protein BJ944DRAFT_236973 [Cunninghamella echinulata]